MTTGLRLAWCASVALFAAGSLWSAPALASDQEPRAKPLSSAERQAVKLVAEFLANGEEAWLPQLASSSPLRRYGTAGAAEAIALRTGPHDKATWRLQTQTGSESPGRAVFGVVHPSGMDDTVVLQLVEEAGTWKLVDIRSSIDAMPAVAGKLAGEHHSTLRAPALGAGLLTVLLAVTGRRKHLRLAAAVASVLVIWTSALGCQRSADRRARTIAKKTPAARATDPLVSLLPLERALAAGKGVDIEALFARAPTNGPAAQIARLWKADLRLRQSRLREAEELLKPATGPESPPPLQPWLASRLAFLQGKEEAAMASLEEAIAVGVAHDGLTMEIVDDYLQFGRPYEAAVELRKLAVGGSRDAEVYYLLAETAVIDNAIQDAVPYFTAAWQLRPVERSRLFERPGLARLATDPKIYELLHVGSAREPLVEPRAAERQPLTLPAVAELSLIGEHLTIRIGGNRLEVPNGAVLAPLNTLMEDAGARARREETEALEDIRQWRESQTAVPLGQPEARHRLERVAGILARAGKWDELLRLSDGIAGELDQAPAGLVVVRAIALLKTHRDPEAMDLLVGLAKSERASRRRDPRTFVLLAQVLRQEGEYDLTLRLLKRAATMTKGGWEARIRQVEMEQALAKSGLSLTTGSFALRYPPVARREYVGGLGDVLTQERKRIRHWVPVPAQAATPLGVDLFPVNDFLAAYSTELAVVGIYDGRVRLPFADLGRLSPRIVAILSHELAHAMIAEATHDLAPVWFQEGLAQHVEMHETRPNTFRYVVKADRALSLTIVDAALSGFSEPQFVALAYEQAEATVAFLEHRYGAAGLRQLTQAFAAGMDTEEALASTFGLSIADLDAELAAWATGEAPATFRGAVHHYELQLEETVERADMAAQRAVTGVGPTVETPRPPPGAVAQLAVTPELAAWHASYLAAVAPVRGDVSAAFKVLEGDTLDEAARARCTTLRESANRLLSDPTALHPPLVTLATDLAAAFTWLDRMAFACEQGDLEGARGLRTRAEAAFASAASELAASRLPL